MSSGIFFRGISGGGGIFTLLSGIRIFLIGDFDIGFGEVLAMILEEPPSVVRG